MSVVAMRLKAHLRFCYCRDGDEDKAAARELRALLAVARAAERMTVRDIDGNFPGLSRALSRLRSLSGLRAPSTVDGNSKLPANSRPAQKRRK